MRQHLGGSAFSLVDLLMSKRRFYGQFEAAAIIAASEGRACPAACPV